MNRYYILYDNDAEPSCTMPTRKDALRNANNMIGIDNPVAILKVMRFKKQPVHISKVIEDLYPGLQQSA